MAKKIQSEPEKEKLLRWLGQAHLEPGMSVFRLEGILAKHIQLADREKTSLELLRTIKQEIETSK